MTHLPGPTDDWWYGRASSPTSSGERIDEQTALTCAAVYAAVKVLAETVACLPLDVYRHLPNGGSAPARNHPLQRIVHDEFNPETSSFLARETMQGHLGTWGNAYAEIERTRRRQPLALWPLVPSRVTPYRSREDGKIWYRYRQTNGETRNIPAADMFHVPGFGYDGLVGYSPVAMMAEPIGYNKAAERYGSELFANDARPSGTIETPARLSDKAYKRLQEAGENVVGKRHRMRILEEGAKFAASAMKPEDVQMIQARRFGIEEIARAYRIAPHLLQDLTHGTYSNITELGKEFITYTMVPWFQRWLGEINRRLLSPEYFAKFNTRAFLQGDHKTRAEFYAALIRTGVLTLNQVLELEDMNPIDPKIGDVHFISRDMIPVTMLINAPVPEQPADKQAAILQEAIRRMLGIEANAARQYAKDPSRFLSRLDSFYVRHGRRVREALTPLVKAGYRPHSAMSVEDNVIALVDAHIARSREDLLTAAECQPNELVDKVSQCVDRWNLRTITAEL
ncbi:MAG: phage portal protein [Planctomycetota bacterium]